MRDVSYKRKDIFLLTSGKTMVHISKRAIHHFLVSAVVAAVLLVILLLTGKKHRITLLDHHRKGSREIIFYEDLDHDGYSEKISCQRNVADTRRLGVLVYAPGDRIIDQWNFPGDWGRLARPFTGDINGDGSDEILLFTCHDDSLYLNALDPIHGKVLFQEKAFTRVRKKADSYDYHVRPGFLFDRDGDGVKEVYFVVSCGFSIRPRRVFAYDMVRDTFLISPASCNYLRAPRMHDLDRDGMPEIFCSSSALGNCKLSRPYTDHFSWIMIFRPDLTFKFPPIRLMRYPSNTSLGVLAGEKEDYLFVFHHYRGNEHYPSFVALLNSKGEVLKKRELGDEFPNIQYNLVYHDKKPGQILMVGEEGRVFSVDTSLMIKDLFPIPPVSIYFYQALDLDNDGNNETIFRGKDSDRFVVIRSDHKGAREFIMPHEIKKAWFSVIKNGGKSNKFFLSTNDYSYLFSYDRRFLYRYWLFVYFLSFVGVSLVFFLLEKVREYKRLKVADTQRKIYELQLRSFQNQLDPHFTFNAITSLGSLIYTEKKEKAYDYLVKFSGLIRKILESSDKISQTLQEELDFIRNYLDLQQFRFKNRIEYRIEVAPGVNQGVLVPRMIIETHVENALNHGLKHSDKKGMILIKIMQEKSVLVIEVIDNGIGRVKAAEISKDSTRLGLRVTEQFYMLINKYNRQKISRSIIDLYDEEGNPAGTRVVIRIPGGIRYEI